MPRLRNLIFRLVAVLFGLALAVVAAEVGLRVARFPGPPLRSGRLETQHRSPPSRPDFRDRRNPLTEPKAAGGRRVVVIGDSFTWGAGVLPQDAYPDRMQAELDRRARAAQSAANARRDETAPGAPDAAAAGGPPAAAAPRPPIEVVNFSRPGWNTTQELGALRRAFDRLEPDVLVVGYCLNDAEPHRRRELLELRRGVHPRQPATSLGRFLFAHSAVYRIGFQRADNVRMRRATAAYYHRFYVDGQPTWEATRRALGEIRQLAASRQVPMLLVVFPIFDSQLDHRYRYHALHQTMVQAAGALGIEVMDLLPRYAGIDARRLALDPFLDAHPSELAHRIAAMAILEELAARGLLSPPVAADWQGSAPSTDPAAPER